MEHFLCKLSKISFYQEIFLEKKPRKSQFHKSRDFLKWILFSENSSILILQQNSTKQAGRSVRAYSQPPPGAQSHQAKAPSQPSMPKWVFFILKSPSSLFYFF